MHLIKYDPKKHDVQYDENTSEIIFMCGDDMDISCRIPKDVIAQMNNVIVEPYGDDMAMYIDGEFHDLWTPSADQLMNALRHVERNVFNHMYQYRLELNIDTGAILSNILLVAACHGMSLKVNFSQKELVLS